MTFKCQRCGYCCTLLARVSLLDIIRLKNAGISISEIIQKDSTGKNCLRLKDDGDCVFLERHNKKCACKIYEFRPRVCRKYPGYGTDIPCKKANPSVREYLLRF